MKREKILEEAIRLITQERAEQHGDARKNFETISVLWSEILKIQVEPHQVALCMASLKIARLVSNSKSEDSWIDLAGYAALGGEFA